MGNDIYKQKQIQFMFIRKAEELCTKLKLQTEEDVKINKG